MHTVGLLGAPRRTAYTTYGGNAQASGWIPYEAVMAVGGMILFAGVILMICNIVALLRAPHGEEEFPIGEEQDGAEETPKLFERWGVWLGIAVVLIFAAYAIPVADMINNGVGVPGYKTW
jgi:cytochrome c oxidase subunit 1